MKLKILVLITIFTIFTSYVNASSEDCKNAKDDAESVRSDLENYTKKLYRCVQYQSDDFSDDCYSEFRRVKSYHSDFESAVSEVRSYCD